MLDRNSIMVVFVMDEARMLEEMPPRGGKASELWISGDMYPQDMDPAIRKSNKTGTQDVIKKD